MQFEIDSSWKQTALGNENILNPTYDCDGVKKEKLNRRKIKQIFDWFKMTLPGKKYMSGLNGRPLTLSLKKDDGNILIVLS